jgi:hypothetical protein
MCQSRSCGYKGIGLERVRSSLQQERLEEQLMTEGAIFIDAYHCNYSLHRK